MKGYNLGFFYSDIDTIYSRCNGKIIYSNDEQKRILLNLVDGLEEYYRHTKEMADTFSLQLINEWHWDELISYFTLFKHSDWSIEEEYRVVYLINKSWAECLVKEKYGPKPFIEIPICHYSENRCDLPLWEIGIGPKNGISDKEVKLLFSKVKTQYADINRSEKHLR